MMETRARSRGLPLVASTTAPAMRKFAVESGEFTRCAPAAEQTTSHPQATMNARLRKKNLLIATRCWEPVAGASVLSGPRPVAPLHPSCRRPASLPDCGIPNPASHDRKPEPGKSPAAPPAQQAFRQAPPKHL